MPNTLTKWTTHILGDLCDICRGSSPRPIADQRYFVDGTIPWIKIADATKSGKYLYKTKEHVNEFGASFSRYLPAGSLIIAASGTLGYPQMLGVKGCAHDGWLIPSNFRGIDSHFLYYYFLWKKEFFYSSAYGAAIQNINTMILKEMEVTIPSLPTQRMIASILSAYDDLIENNTRRIAILEEMAQAIYREWFVNFRFPGHENVKFVDSPLGKIPEGWEAGVVNDLLELLSGFAFKSKTFIDEGDYKVVTIKHVHDGVFQPNSMSLLDSPPDRMPSHCHLETADVLMSLTGNIGRTCLVFGENYLLNQRVAKLHPHRQEDRPLVYWMFRSPETRQRLEQIANGVAQQNLSPVQTGKMAVPIPPVDLRDRYSEVASPMVEAILSLNRKNFNLRTTRDLLLPKLISGQLDVEDLDIDVGMTAEELTEAAAG